MRNLLIIVLCTLNSNLSIAQDYFWRKLDTEPFRGKQDDIDFIDGKEGWYVNGTGKLYHTTDGGATWELQHEQSGTFFRCVNFINKKVGFIGNVGKDYFPNVSDSIPLYRTMDGGTTWEPVNYDGPYVKGLCALSVIEEDYINHGVLDKRHHIYGVGRVGSPANMMVSHDSGATWTSHPLNDYAKMLMDIKMFDQKNGVACAGSSADIAESNALMLRTNDGGKTWREVYRSNRPYEILWKTDFPSEDVGYATIQSYNPDTTNIKQRLIKTTDGGLSWSEILLAENPKARQFGVGFLNEAHGFVGTMVGGFETRDGGSTWKKTDLGIATNKIRFYEFDSGVISGWAIGVDIYKLSN